MKTYVLDTSFVIRVLTGSPLHLFESAIAFLEQWSPEKPVLYIPNLVLAEAYFALQHHYRYPKAEALAALTSLANHPAIGVSPDATPVLALTNLASAKPGFIDRLIHAGALATGADLVTFEKSARKLKQTLVL